MAPFAGCCERSPLKFHAINRHLSNAGKERQCGKAVRVVVSNDRPIVVRSELCAQLQHVKPLPAPILASCAGQRAKLR